MKTSGRGVMISPARRSVISKMLWMSSFSSESRVPVSSPTSTSARNSASEIISRVCGPPRSPSRKRIPSAIFSSTNRTGATTRENAWSGAAATSEKARARGHTRHFGVTSPISRIPSVPASRARSPPLAAGRCGRIRAAMTDEIATLTISFPRKIVAINRLGLESIRAIHPARRSPSSFHFRRSTRRSAKSAVSVAEKKAEARKRKGRRIAFTGPSACPALPGRKVVESGRESRPFDPRTVRAADADPRGLRHRPDQGRARREGAGEAKKVRAPGGTDGHQEFVILPSSQERGQRVEPEGGRRRPERPGDGERLLCEDGAESVALEKVREVREDPVAHVDHRRDRAGARRRLPLAPACRGGKVRPHRLPAPPGRPRRTPAAQKLEPQARPSRRPGDVEEIPRPGAGAGDEPAAPRGADHRQAEGEPFAPAGVPAHQPDPGRPCGGRHAAEDRIDRRHGNSRGGAQGDQVTDGGGSHRRQVGEVGGEGASSHLFRAEVAEGEVRPLDQQVGGENRAPARNAHHRRVVADGKLPRTRTAAALSTEEIDQAGFAHVPQEIPTGRGPGSGGFPLGAPRHRGPFAPETRFGFPGPFAGALFPRRGFAFLFSRWNGSFVRARESTSSMVFTSVKRTCRASWRGISSRSFPFLAGAIT